MKIDVFSLSFKKWHDILSSWEETPFRINQILSTLWKENRLNFSESTTLSLSLRQRLDESFFIPEPPIPSQITRDEDGTIKVLFTLEDGQEIESVAIPMEDRLTFCLSSQSGCAMGCHFCATAGLGFRRNLKLSEILNQIRGLCHVTGCKPTNLVFMGMGEPLQNLVPVRDTLDLLCQRMTWNWPESKSTVSTCGWVPGIEEIMRNPIKSRLALSLNAVTNDLRNQLMPVNRRYPIAKLLETIRAYNHATGKTVFIEYVLLDGLNDRPADARVLTRLLKNLDTKVNLIPYNPHAGAPYRSAHPSAIENFRRELQRGNIFTTLRSSRGNSIAAACGQLAGRSGRRAA